MVDKKELTIEQVKKIFVSYDEHDNKVDQIKTALVEAMTKRSSVVKQIYEATNNKKSFNRDGTNLKLRIRHKDKENPNFETANYYFAGDSEEAMEL